MYNGVIRLDFNDQNNTVLYLGTSEPIEVTTNSRCGDTVFSIRITYFSNFTNFSLLLYDTEEARDIDHRYLLEQLDILMGVDREEV